ncbi:MAG TPA: QueG-associated DUF1730 domain-containing protein, partial [Draconibacterium sp.]|nr:QueG-associated DUF1730 domain-containing protein [Draconibacterium sp.]
MENRIDVNKTVISKAKSLGFLDASILPAEELSEEKEHFENWLSENMHGEMGYMARNVEKRLNPKLLLENAKSIIVVLQNYYPKETQKDLQAPVLSKYAYGTDYHFVMKDKLKKLLQFIQNEIQPC